MESGESLWELLPIRICGREEGLDGGLDEDEEAFMRIRFDGLSTRALVESEGYRSQEAFSLFIARGFIRIGDLKTHKTGKKSIKTWPNHRE